MSEPRAKGHRSNEASQSVQPAVEDEQPPDSGAPPSAVAADSAEATQDDGTQGGYDEHVVAVLAAKILIDWLRNRRQLLAPFTLDLQKLGPSEVEVLIQAMISALRADGEHAGKERERIDGALQILNASAEQHASVERLLERPQALPEVLARVSDTESRALVYAASLVAIDARKLVNRLYLRYLATRLQLPDELVKTLGQRFRTAK